MRYARFRHVDNRGSLLQLLYLIRDATASLVGIENCSMSYHWESNEILELRKFISDCTYFRILTNLIEKMCQIIDDFFYRPGRLNPRWEWPDSRCRDGKGQFEMISRIRDATVSLILGNPHLGQFIKLSELVRFRVKTPELRYK